MPNYGHEVYEYEAIERLPKHVAKTVSDCDPSTVRERVMMETAYRRGFCQGFWHCLYASENGYGRDRLRKHYMRLHRWRLLKHGGKLVEPPMLPVVCLVKVCE